MKFFDVLKKVENSEAYKNFKKQHKNSYLAAGFFVLDFEEGKHMQQIDYVTKNEIATFYVNGEIKIKLESKKEIEREIGIKEELAELKLPKKLAVDIEDIEDKAKDVIDAMELGDRAINKIIAVLQIHNSKTIWNLTCILSGFLIVTIHIDAVNGDILFNEKKDIFDIMRKLY